MKFIESPGDAETSSGDGYLGEWEEQRRWSYNLATGKVGVYVAGQMDLDYCTKEYEEIEPRQNDTIVLKVHRLKVSYELRRNGKTVEDLPMAH